MLVSSIGCDENVLNKFHIIHQAFGLFLLPLIKGDGIR